MCSPLTAFAEAMSYLSEALTENPPARSVRISRCPEESYSASPICVVSKNCAGPFRIEPIIGPLYRSPPWGKRARIRFRAVGLGDPPAGPVTRIPFGGRRALIAEMPWPQAAGDQPAGARHRRLGEPPQGSWPDRANVLGYVGEADICLSMADLNDHAPAEAHFHRPVTTDPGSYGVTDPEALPGVVDDAGPDRTGDHQRGSCCHGSESNGLAT